MRTNVNFLLFFSLVIVNSSLFSKTLLGSKCPTLNYETMNALTTSKEGKTILPNTNILLERTSKYSSKAAFTRGASSIFRSSAKKEQKAYQGNEISAPPNQDPSKLHCAYTISPFGTKQTVTIQMDNPIPPAPKDAPPPLPEMYSQGDNYNPSPLPSRPSFRRAIPPSQSVDSDRSGRVNISSYRNTPPTASPLPNPSHTFSDPLEAPPLPDIQGRVENYNEPIRVPSTPRKSQLNLERPPALLPDNDEADLAEIRNQGINIAEEPKSIRNNESSSSNFTRKRAQARNLGSEVNRKSFNRTFSPLPDSAAQQDHSHPLESSANEEQAFAPPQTLTPRPSRRQSVSRQDAKGDMPPAYGNPALMSTPDIPQDNFPPLVADDNSNPLPIEAETPISPAEEVILPLQGIPPAPPPPSQGALSSKSLPSQGNPPPAPLFTGYTPKVNKEFTQASAGTQQKGGQIPNNQAQNPSAGHPNAHLDAIQKGIRLNKVDATKNKKKSTLSPDEQELKDHLDARREGIRGNDEDDEDWGDASQNSNGENAGSQDPVINPASHGRARTASHGKNSQDTANNFSPSYSPPHNEGIKAQGMADNMQPSMSVNPPASSKNHPIPVPPPLPPVPPVQQTAGNENPRVPSKISLQQPSGNIMDAIIGKNYKLKHTSQPENKPPAQNSTGFNMDVLEKKRREMIEQERREKLKEKNQNGEFDDIDKLEGVDDGEWDD